MYGELEVPEEKLPELNQCIMKLLERGGMMDAERASSQTSHIPIVWWHFTWFRGAWHLVGYHAACSRKYDVAVDEIRLGSHAMTVRSAQFIFYCAYQEISNAKFLRNVLCELCDGETDWGAWEKYIISCSGSCWRGGK